MRYETVGHIRGIEMIFVKILAIVVLCCLFIGLLWAFVKCIEHLD
jgi:hypothetical protein